MPFDSRGLMPLLATSPFAVWHYRTSDSRVAVLKPGYFSAAAGQLQAGHLVILQAGDSMTFLPVRDAGTVGDGLVLDTTLAPLRVMCSASVRFGAIGTATATIRTVDIDALQNPSQVENTLATGATVTGPSRELRFTLLNVFGAVISGPVTGTVSSGRAEVELPAPATGDGYRLRVVDADEISVSRTSSPFSIVRSGTSPVVDNRVVGLLAENGNVLRTESSDRLVF